MPSCGIKDIKDIKSTDASSAAAHFMNTLLDPNKSVCQLLWGSLSPSREEAFCPCLYIPLMRFITWHTTKNSLMSVTESSLGVRRWHGALLDSADGSFSSYVICSYTTVRCCEPVTGQPAATPITSAWRPVIPLLRRTFNWPETIYSVSRTHGVCRVGLLAKRLTPLILTSLGISPDLSGILFIHNTTVITSSSEQLMTTCWTERIKRGTGDHEQSKDTMQAGSVS